MSIFEEGKIYLFKFPQTGLNCDTCEGGELCVDKTVVQHVVAGFINISAPPAGGGGGGGGG